MLVHTSELVHTPELLRTTLERAQAELQTLRAKVIKSRLETYSEEHLQHYVKSLEQELDAMLASSCTTHDIVMWGHILPVLQSAHMCVGAEPPMDISVDLPPNISFAGMFITNLPDEAWLLRRLTDGGVCSDFLQRTLVSTLDEISPPECRAGTLLNVASELFNVSPVRLLRAESFDARDWHHQFLEVAAEFLADRQDEQVDFSALPSHLSRDAVGFVESLWSHDVVAVPLHWSSSRSPRWELFTRKGRKYVFVDSKIEFDAFCDVVGRCLPSDWQMPEVRNRSEVTAAARTSIGNSLKRKTEPLRFSEACICRMLAG